MAKAERERKLADLKKFGATFKVGPIQLLFRCQEFQACSHWSTGWFCSSPDQSLQTSPLEVLKRLLQTSARRNPSEELPLFSLRPSPLPLNRSPVQRSRTRSRWSSPRSRPSIDRPRSRPNRSLSSRPRTSLCPKSRGRMAKLRPWTRAPEPRLRSRLRLLVPSSTRGLRRLSSSRTRKQPISSR